MHRLARFAAILSLLVAAHAEAGITIHFEGTAANAAAVERMTDIAVARAERNGWRSQRIGDGQVATLDAITLKMLEEAQGSKELSDLRGVVVYPDDLSEPLYLVFASKLRTKNFVKTQFAGPAVHVQLVELLEALKPQFADLDVDDEGEYWSTHDRARLEKHLGAATAAMAAFRAQTPDAHGPVKRPDGRILDIVR